MSSFFASMPGAKRYTVTFSSVPPTLIAGKVPGGSERMPPAQGVLLPKTSSSSSSRRLNWARSGFSEYMLPNISAPPWISSLGTAEKSGHGRRLQGAPPEGKTRYELLKRRQAFLHFPIGLGVEEIAEETGLPRRTASSDGFV